MNPVILFRSDNSIEQNAELNTARKYFDVVRLRSEVPAGSLVVARFSALPYYRELESDLINNKSLLINSSREHSWIADFDYYEDLKELTPRSWTEYEFPRADYDGPLVIKGRTNSRKHQWASKMFAKDRKAAISVASELANDPLIGPQGLIYREYVHLVALGHDLITEMPFANEWRMFYYKRNLLASGYYWSNAPDDVRATARLDDEGLAFANHVASIAAEHATFFVIDIAEKQSGGWILIEINDGQMSGLSDTDADQMYSALSVAIANENPAELFQKNCS